MISGDPIRIVPPAAMPVTLAELKAHCRLDGINGDSEDAYLAGLLRVATEEVETYTGLALITSTWKQTFSAWPTTKQPHLFLRRRPLQGVTLIEFRSDIGSPAGTTAVLDPSVYSVTGVGADKTPGSVRLGYLGSWPTVIDDAEAITITYTAGYGDDWNSVPELIRWAVMMAAATHYAYREDITMGTLTSELPSTSKNLLRDWRPLAVA